MLKLNIAPDKIAEARGYAKNIANSFDWLFAGYSSVTIERTILRLMGMDGAIEGGEPIPNIVVDHLKGKSIINRGAAYWVANAMFVKGVTVQEVGDAVATGELDLSTIEQGNDADVMSIIDECTDKMLKHIKKQSSYREDCYARFGPRRRPSLYVIVATGNIYEDVTQAKAAARQGADIIAVIRSTAQSLLDYVPYGATTVGFGGTFATQENFKIMRKALDEVGEELERYISLTNYASGLCMPEIAAMGAIERLDVMLNDAMYGILFRDINPKRTILDQYFSRMINAYAGIEIQTGEDNYLTTSDAIEKAYTVTASQLINEQFAYISGLKPEKMGLGHAYEINPEVENSFSYELSHALLTSTLFPTAPTKYMPPTKFASGNIFKTHLMDAMFNMVGQITNQGVQLLGMLTEAIHTPHLADRAMAIENANYLFTAVKDFASEITLEPNGFINTRAETVLSEATEFLKKVSDQGLFEAMSSGDFADIKRFEDKGKGLEGVFPKDEDYINPFMERMKVELGLNK
ncbi:MAG: D-lysine 5,6-aminomutase subunit alpha [Candidatus Cloacimonetes bacterium 4572_65]|nr:MAG: D-lysine 5,6-aminomutase subunit alpha [Candidatus Cloacimonetes bacterium 4572_65]